MQDITGYLRDFVVAVLGVAMILNWMDQELAGGVLLVVMTGVALATHLWEKFHGTR
jgi:hypothetical protein